MFELGLSDRGGEETGRKPRGGCWPARNRFGGLCGVKIVLSNEWLKLIAKRRRPDSCQPRAGGMPQNEVQLPVLLTSCARSRRSHLPLTMAAYSCEWSFGSGPASDQSSRLSGQDMPSLSRRQFVNAAAFAATLAGIPRSGGAADYPSRPVRLVIPYAAGGSGDQIGRPWVERMSSQLGPTFVENIGGGGGAIGTTAVARAEPDGYSLLLGNGSTQVIIPLTTPNPAYSIGDFRAIYRLINSALVFAVHPSVPATNLRDLIAYARINPGTLSYGTPGIGTGNHLVGELFKQQAGALDIVHVPYKGISQATNDLVSGQISLVVAVMSVQLQQLSRAGKIRLLAVTTERRLCGAPA